MKRINFIFLTAALVIILLVVEIIIVRSMSKYEPEINIVFAGEKIKEGSIIEAGMLKMKKISMSMAHRQALKDIEDALDKKARMDIEEGEMLLLSKLVSETEEQEVHIKDKNSRLFSVEFKADQANGWLLRQDQYVDIIFVPNRNEGFSASVQQDMVSKGENEGNEMHSEEYEVNVKRIRNIRVAALIDEKGNVLKKRTEDSMPRYISFEVNQQQDELLAYAKGSGRLEISVIPK